MTLIIPHTESLGWSPKDKDTLLVAIVECLRMPPADLPHGSISSWDVSAVTDMSGLFIDSTGDIVPGADKFNGDLSKWKVSRVTDMSAMFYSASSFNADLSKWDVSGVKYMIEMFNGASSFAGKLCGTWLISKADKHGMFEGSSGEICGKTLTDTPQPSPWPLPHGNHHSVQC